MKLKQITTILFITLLWHNIAGQPQVSNITPYSGSYYKSFFVDENTGYVVTSVSSYLFCTYPNNVLKTFDGGKTWFNTTFNSNQIMYSVFFIDKNVGWVAGQGGNIYKTTDGGNNWTPQSSGSSYDLTDIFFIDANIGYATGANGSVRKTINGGSKWTTSIVAVVNTPSFNAVYFTSPTVGYIVGGSGKMQKTINGGTSWTTLSVGYTTTLSDVCFIDDTVGFVLTGSGIVRTSDAGITWKRVLSSSELMKSVHFPDENVGYALSGTGRIYRTLDRGKNWLEIDFLNTTCNDIFFPNGFTGYVCAINGQIFGSKEGGKFKNLLTGFSSLLTNVCTTDSLTAYVTDGIGMIAKTETAGVNWHYTYRSQDSINNIGFSNQKNKGWAIGKKGKILSTTDAGETWINQSSNTSKELNKVFCIDSNQVIIVGNGIILKTKNSGLIWKPVMESGIDNMVDICFQGKNKLFAISRDGKMYTSTDKGDSWKLHLNLSSLGSLSSISFANDSVGYFNTTGGSFYYTKTQGETWHLRSNDINWSMPFFLFSPSKAFIGVSSGLKVTTDSSKTYGTVPISCNGSYAVKSMDFSDTLHGLFVGGYYSNYLVYKYVANDQFNLVCATHFLCSGSSADVGLQVQKEFYSNNVFTVQLSDSNGSFASPITIGTKASPKSGLIRITIPNSILSGKKYKIRAVSSVPNIIFSKEIPIEIGNSKPELPIIFPIENKCDNSPLLIATKNDQFESGSTYRWSLNGNPIDGKFSQLLLASYKQGDSVMLQITGRIGCRSTDTTLATSYVINLWKPQTEAGNDIVFCKGETVTLNASGGTQFTWKPLLNISDYTSSSPTVFATSSTKYYVTSLDSIGCPSTDSVNVVPVSKPDSSFVISGDKLSAVVSGKNISFQWYFNGQPIPSAVGKEWQAEISGSYFLEVKEGECKNISQSVSIIITGMNSDLDFSHPVIYPNPSSSGLFKVDGLWTEASIIVTDMWGMQVPIEYQDGQLNLSQQPKGIYFAQFLSQGQIRRIKLVVE